MTNKFYFEFMCDDYKHNINIISKLKWIVETYIMTSEDKKNTGSQQYQ